MVTGATKKHLSLLSAAVVASLVLAGCSLQEEKPDKFNACLDTVTLQFSAISMGSGDVPACGPSEAAVSWLADVSGSGEPAVRAVPTEAAPGVTGDTGADGAVGATGADGAAGAKGDTGESSDGATGAKGDSGADGADGADGLKGDTGGTGATGVDGADGATGADGADGVEGDTGATGATGASGVKGDTGADGATGATGEKGDTGATGATGATGEKGDAGANGATGATGLPGTDGNSILNGYGQPADALGADGDFYLDITDFAVFGPKSAGAWPGTTQRLIGPEGPIGPQGVAGETGAAGSDGGAGAMGAPGPQGAQGLPGADGAQGLTGPAGKDGATGPQGPAGPAGGTSVADPNPNNLTYRMRIGTEPAVQITGFTQTITNSGTTQYGSVPGVGKAEFGDIVATLPMNSRILAQMMALAKGTHTPTATVEMCKPGEVTGRCTLELSLTEVMVVGVDVRQDPTQATATVQLNFAREKVSVLPGTAQAVTYEWDIPGNEVTSESGTTLARSTGDTTYTTTLTGSDSIISTRSWSQSSTQSGTSHDGGGGGAGKANFADIVAETRTGPGTVALFRAVASGEILPSVQIAGCEVSNCAAKTVLSDGLVTGLVLGSPALFDQVQFTYAAIKWDRNDDLLRPNQNKTFSWDVAQNVASS